MILYLSRVQVWLSRKFLRDKLKIAFALDISGVHSLLSKCKKVTTL